MIDLSREELDRLYEGSKNDRFIVVGSEVRQMVGMIMRSDARIETLETLLRDVVNLIDGEVDARAFFSWRNSARAALALEQDK